MVERNRQLMLIDLRPQGFDSCIAKFECALIITEGVVSPRIGEHRHCPQFGILQRVRQSLCFREPGPALVIATNERQQRGVRKEVPTSLRRRIRICVQCALAPVDGFERSTVPGPGLRHCRTQPRGASGIPFQQQGQCCSNVIHHRRDFGPRRRGSLVEDDVQPLRQRDHSFRMS